MGEPVRFDVVAAVGRDLRHTPYLLDGLAALEAAGVARLRLRARRPRRAERVRVTGDGVRRVAVPYPWAADLTVVDHEAGERRRVGVDLQDWRDLWSHTTLSGNDVVLRRMHTPDEVAAVEAAYGVAVVPAGITGPGDADRWAPTAAMRRAALWGRVEAAWDQPSRLVPRRRPGRRAPASSVGPSGVPAPVGSLPTAGRPYAFFQVAHHDWPGSAAAEALNGARAQLIRALRAGLGERFVGGMTFAGAVPEAYADCRSDLPTERSAYLALVERAAVVVAGNGFDGSPPWKLAEYLERGCAIVAEPAEATLPTPLEDGVHLRLFTTPEQAVARCEELLADEAARQRLGRAAAAYHRDEVAPVALARRALLAGSEVPWAA